MGFYGMLLGLTLLFSALLVANLSQKTSMTASFSNDFNSYSNIQKIEMFKNIIESTQTRSNSMAYPDWLNSLCTSANIDGVNMNVSNGTILISTKSMPKVYAVVQVG